MSKRPRVQEEFITDREHWCANSVQKRDFLKELYPHERDAHCYMDELTHTYFVLGRKYKYSVSAVWKVFFNDFDAAAKAAEMMSRAKKEKLRCLCSSVYNLYMYLVFSKNEVPESKSFWTQVESSASEAVEICKTAERPVSLAITEVLREMRALLSSPGVRSRARKSCYFLAMCAGCCEKELENVWLRNGSLEAFKGTLMHKQAELYLQELGAWQLENCRSHVTMGEMQACPRILARARAAASSSAALRAVASVIKQEVWDHPATQLYLSSFLAQDFSLEFQQVESWMLRHSSLSPFRAEWSIYNEAAEVAGQVDSLWFDESCGELLMVDWKRARTLLTADVRTQAAQAFGAKGRATCVAAPAHPGPCASMFDCAYNHYKIQQHLYADFLYQKYNLKIARMLLVQCHPDLGNTELDFNEVDIEEESGLSARALSAFGAGWRGEAYIASTKSREPP